MAPTLLTRRDITVNAAKRPTFPERKSADESPSAASSQTQSVAQKPRDTKPAKPSGRMENGAIRIEILSALDASEEAVTAAQIAEKKGLAVERVTNAMTKIIKEGLVTYIKSGLTRRYFRVGKTTSKLRTNPPDLSKAPAASPAPSQPAKSQQPAAKLQPKTAKLATETAKTATAEPAAKLPAFDIPQFLPNAPERPFRCAICSDGSLMLAGGDAMRDEAGNMFLPSADVAIMVMYLHRAVPLEFGV